MRWAAPGLIAAALLAGGVGAASADTRLVVFEVHDCAPCAGFRAGVLPAYWGPAATKRPAMTIVDADALGTAGFPLAHRLATFPTIVLMRDGRERARIEGPVAREQLRALVEQMQDLPPK